MDAPRSREGYLGCLESVGKGWAPFSTLVLLEGGAGEDETLPLVVAAVAAASPFSWFCDSLSLSLSLSLVLCAGRLNGSWRSSESL